MCGIVWYTQLRLPPAAGSAGAAASSGDAGSRDDVLDRLLPSAALLPGRKRPLLPV
jgi:hypothetical protein